MDEAVILPWNSSIEVSRPTDVDTKLFIHRGRHSPKLLNWSLRPVVVGSPLTQVARFSFRQLAEVSDIGRVSVINSTPDMYSLLTR